MTDYPNLLQDLGKRMADTADKVKQINRENSMNSFQALLHNPPAAANLNGAGTSVVRQIEKASIIEEDHVIGFEEAAGKVIKLLTGGPEDLEVISIAGMTGLGKTTLAKKIFKDPDVDNKYMIRAFAYVSREYDKKDVLLQILRSFTQIDSEVRKKDEVQLEKHVLEQLEGKKYLVVLDDIWETKDWDYFKLVFPKKNKKSSRILITTRNVRVAEYANPMNPNSLYRLEFLGKEYCQELLRWKVFPNNDCPPSLQEYEKDIVKKCDGLPLAVVLIAGIILKDRENVGWWKQIAGSVKDYMTTDIMQTNKVIELMYQHLPNHLKLCFLYFGVFSEGFDIPVWKLVRLWISEGFILGTGILQQEEGEFQLEDIAEKFLEELVHRNLVMVEQRRSNGKIKTCRMHTALLEFCKKEAREENLFNEINKDNLQFILSGNQSVDSCRRLGINHLNIIDYLSGTPSGKRVRSFLTFTKGETTLEPHLVSCIPKTFKLLRVLEAQSLVFRRFQADLCNLVLLKYVAISSEFSILPSAFSGLWNLQTLIVNTTSPTLEIKADRWSMPQFRHLHTNASASFPYPSTKSQKSRKEDGVGSNVRTLCTISPESFIKGVFDRTPNLKKLGIRGTLSKLFEVSDGSSSPSLFCGLKSLENLKLLNDKTKDTTSKPDETKETKGTGSKPDRLPSVEDFPRQLTQLTLMNTKLGWEEMSKLGKLEKLEVLKLKESAFQGERWSTENGCFRSLKHLYIGRTDLVNWEASRDHFPKLESLKLNYCDKLRAVPDVPSLQLMVLHCINTEAASSARKHHEELRREQAKMGSKRNIFKLSIYPPPDQ